VYEQLPFRQKRPEGDGMCSYLDRGTGHPDRSFSCFSSVCPRNTGVIPQLGHDRFLVHRFQVTFILTFDYTQSELRSAYSRFTASRFVLATSPLRLTTNNFSFQLNICGYSPYVTSSLTKGWVCRLQLLLVLASSVILMSESRGTHEHILLSQIRDSPKLENQIPVCISPRNRHRVPFSSPPTTRRTKVEVFDPASARDS
jgi:hypothetical protein